MDKFIITREQRDMLLNMLNELSHKVARNPIDLLLGLPMLSDVKSENIMQSSNDTAQEMLMSR